MRLLEEVNDLLPQGAQIVLKNTSGLTLAFLEQVEFEITETARESWGRRQIGSLFHTNGSDNQSHSSSRLEDGYETPGSSVMLQCEWNREVFFILHW